MDSPADDAPNVTFLEDALAFLEGKPIHVQSEVIAIASWLFASPAVDGESKFLMPGPRLFGVRTYRRVYIDEQYEIVYGFDSQSDPPLLTVIDVWFARTIEQ